MGSYNNNGSDKTMATNETGQALGEGYYVNNAAPYSPIQKPENKFKPDINDFIFALIAFVLGYLFARWVFFVWQGWGVSVFTTAYLLAATLYLIKKGAFRANPATWFWLIVTWVTGISYSLWENASFTGIRALFLFCCAVYYIIIASGRAVMGKTGNYLLIDGVNAVIILPFRNIINQYVSFSALGRGIKKVKILPAALGLFFVVILFAILIPMLERADSGGFGVVLDAIRGALDFIDIEFVLYFMLAVPVAAYIYGLISGAAHGKGTDAIRPETAQNAVKAMRVMPAATVNIVLGAACLLYAVFILSQIPYFFSAFTGRRPEGWLIYSEYARRGFFELCGIAAINLVVLIAGNLTCKKYRAESKLLKAFNITLTFITLVLIATAFSKMALYIEAYGLTMPRLLPCVFMVFIAIVFIALLVLQKYDFSIVRLGLATGAAMLCALCMANSDALVVRYNTERYLSGTLPSYDMEVLYRSGSAGAGPALEVYNSTQDEELKNEINRYLVSISGIYRAGHSMCLETYLIRSTAPPGGVVPGSNDRQWNGP